MTTMTKEQAFAILDKLPKDTSWGDKVTAIQFPETYALHLDLQKTFKRGFEFIDENNRLGRIKQELVAPNGHVRHLNGYFLDDEPSQFNPEKMVEHYVYARSDRQATNSLIQGFSSEIGCMSGYLLNWLMMKIRKMGVDTGFRFINVVHDSVETEVKFEYSPIVLYTIDNAYTNLCAKAYEDLFGFTFVTDLGIDLDIGGLYSAEHMYGWHWSRAEIVKHMNQIVEDVKHRFEITKRQKKQFMINFDIINKWRMREVKDAIAEQKAGKKSAYTGSHWKKCFRELVEADKLYRNK